MTPDIATNFEFSKETWDYVKREAMVPMRDGVKLYTVMIVPKGAKDAPILLTRTPYNASNAVKRTLSPYAAASATQMDEPFLADGYVRVYQDVRGKHKSEGDYVLTRPLRGPLNTTNVDHSTDAYDTIDWLVKNTPETNGRVGVVGSSYPGFTAAMALVNPHPALKAAAPQSPMIDGWMGDDWFQNGAFRQVNFDFFTSQMSAKAEGSDIPRQGFDDYENFLRAGSAGDFAKAAGLQQIPAWRKIAEHPAYDQFWQEQALDKILARQPLSVPTLWIGALWDQEDIYGAIKAYEATEPKDTAMRPLYLRPGLSLGFDRPAGGREFEEYVSDPAKPVPYVRRPVRWDDSDQWRFWLVSDQRHVDGRPGVLTFVSDPLKAPLKIAGSPVANIFASTSGTDSDWVVKLIDVYPDIVPSNVAMGGYQLSVATEIFRGRYRDSFEKPSAIPANKVQRYRFELPPTNHVFQPGHRVMVQVQSSLFPLYDRNPQTYVENIFFAKPGDYRKATQRIYQTGANASAIELPVVP